MEVLIAPDKFRGSLTAPAAAAAMATGVHRAVPGARVVLRPVADGGEGTVDAFVAAGWSPVTVRVAGPTGVVGPAVVARRDDRAVVELAACCGLPRLPGGVPAPRTATSRGAGEAVLAVLREGAREVVVGLGGSASTDGGVGFLGALGVVLRDDRGEELPSLPQSLHHAATVDLTRLAPEVAGARLVLATDVTSVLTGPGGAAAVFAPQKGAGGDDVRVLADGLERWADLLARRGQPVRDLPGGGAAGGVAAGVVGVLGGVADVGVVSGARTVVDAVGVPAVVAGADLVLTGEGSFDRQSLAGKAPVTVAAVAAAAGVPVVVVCGRAGADLGDPGALGITDVRSLGAAARPLEDPMRDADRLVARVSADVVREFVARA